MTLAPGARVAAPARARPLPLRVEVAEGVEPAERSCSWEGACSAAEVACGERAEGCPLGGLRLWVAVRWRAPVDLDLYVRTPGGALLGPVGGWEASGGRLLRDGQGDCAPEPSEARHAELAGWPAGTTPPPGRYAVLLHYRGGCVSGSGPVRAWVAAGSADRPGGTWVVTLGPGERREVLRLDVAGGEAARADDPR